MTGAGILAGGEITGSFLHGCRVARPDGHKRGSRMFTASFSEFALLSRKDLRMIATRRNLWRQEPVGRR